MNTVIAGSMATVWAIIVILALGVAAGFAFWGGTPGGKVLTDVLSQPLDGAKTATVEIDTGDSNLTIDRLTSGEAVLASGSLQYLEKEGPPVRTVNRSNDQVQFSLRHGEAARPWFRLPWAACNGASEMQIHLNPIVVFDITAHSDGGNVKLDLAGMAVTRVMADTGGGNMDVMLPENAANLSVAAKTGAGNVTVVIGDGITGSSSVSATSGAGNVAVHLPNGVNAKVHATSGMGKVIVDPQFTKLDDNTYQSPGYDDAANRVEITVKSGAGNVTVDTL